MPRAKCGKSTERTVDFYLTEYSDAEDLASCGQTGRGKTHMTTTLGIAATSAGYPVRFWQTAQLVLQLGKAKHEGTLDRLLADVAKARLLVLDEFGYVPFDVDGARLLYQVISESYETLLGSPESLSSVPVDGRLPFSAR